MTYAYDSASITNGKGRLASVSSSVSSYGYSGYDATGKVLGGSETLGSQTYSLSYLYDLSGHVTSILYPSNRVVNYNYDSAGRLNDKDSTHLAFTGNLGDGTTRTYTKGITYGPGGQMMQEQFGTTAAVYNKLAYNSRGQLLEIRAGTASVDDNRGKIVNDYGTTGNNGNLQKQTVYVPINDANTSPISWYQQYSYDSLNRLTQVHEYTGNIALDWQQAFSYDRWGNRTINNNSSATWGDGINNVVATIDTANNRMYATNDSSHSVIDYDAAGNQTKDYLTSNGRRTYDAKNRMITATDSSNHTSAYSYAGDGRRVKRNISNTETWQVYGVGGELLAEYPQNGSASSPQKEYGYRNGQLLVTATAGSGTPPTFTDNPLTVSTSIVKAVHITELRDAINQARAHAGLSVASWTDSSLSSVSIKAVHNTELRTKLDEARAALGLSTVTWTDASLSGVAVKAVHISELRTKVAETVGTTDIRLMVVDQLGTPRMVFDQTGSLANVSRHDYLPFGEELFAGLRTTSLSYTNNDGARQKFTQKERDIETGLDFFGARYFASTQGRFTTADPVFVNFERLIDPQRLNLYGYVRNNPLAYIDPNGADIVSIQLVSIPGRPNQLAQNDPQWRSSELGRVEQVGPAAKGYYFDYAVNIVVTVTPDDSPDNYDPVQKYFVIFPHVQNSDVHRPGESGVENPDNPEKQNILRTGNTLVWYDNPGLGPNPENVRPAASANGPYEGVFSSTVKPKKGSPGKKTDIVMYWKVRVDVRDGKIVNAHAGTITEEEYDKVTGNKPKKEKKEKKPAG